MADYYPLIAKAVSGLEKSTGEARRALYDRARSALVAQLRGVTPALLESDITRERLGLEEAIRKVETEAARRSRTDPPPRPAPPSPAAIRPARPDMPQPPQPVEAVEMRPTPPQIRVSPPAVPMASEPGHTEPDHTEDGNAGISEEPAREVPASAERPRWSPGGGPSISDRGLKGFRDVVADGEPFAGATAQAADTVPAAPGVMEPPPAEAFEQDEPRIEAEPVRPAARRPPPRDAERALRPPAPDSVRARDAREPQRPRDPEPPRPSSRRLEPPPAPPFFDVRGDQAGPPVPGPDIDDFEPRSEPPTRPPSSMVRQEDLRPRPPAPRVPPPDKRRETRPDKRPEKRPEKRDDGRVDRWAEKPREKKPSRLAALPLRKIAIATLSALIVLAVVGVGVWNRAAVIGYFRSTPNLARSADSRDNGARPKIADRIGGSSNPGADEGAPVAQKVVLYEEDPNDPAGKRYVGSVVWRTESAPPAPGKPPDLAVRADIEIPEQKISARWSLRRNDDKALPASHTVEVMFTLPPVFPHGGITNIPGVLMKQSESTRGVPLAGLAVKVTNNFFLIGLSAVDADRTRNIELLKERGWFDIPVVYNDGRRAIVAVEKGTPGDRAFARAFEAWGQ
jgi:hypothetical protein